LQEAVFCSKHVCADANIQQYYVDGHSIQFMLNLVSLYWHMISWSKLFL